MAGNALSSITYLLNPINYFPMKQITLSFTPEEYTELAKLLYLGAHFTWGADDYANSKLVNELLLKICTNGYVQLPESGAFSIGGGGMGHIKEPEFLVSEELGVECDELEEAYIDRKCLHFLCVALAERDFTEEHGKIDEDEFIRNRELRTIILNKQNDYRQEFIFNSVHNLRLAKK